MDYLNFYTLSDYLNIKVDELFKKYQELFPHIKIFDYTCNITNKERKILIKYFRNK